MGKALKYEIKESHTFVSSEEEALVTLELTADHFQHEVHSVLRHYGLTSTQYSALCILRDKGPRGLTCSELGSHLVSSDPDITRLLDRLAKQRLVRRHREIRDRRMVHTEISEEGLRLVEIISPILDDHIRETFKHMQQHRLRLLIELLDEARHANQQSVLLGMPNPTPAITYSAPQTPSWSERRTASFGPQGGDSGS